MILYEKTENGNLKITKQTTQSVEISIDELYNAKEHLLKQLEMVDQQAQEAKKNIQAEIENVEKSILEADKFGIKKIISQE